MSKKIIITLHGNGEVEIEADGYKGKACETTFDAVISGFGLNPADAKEKPEYFEQVQGQDQNLNQ